MARRSNIEVRGLPNILQAIYNLEDAVRDELDAECLAAAYEMNAEASENISNDTRGYDGGSLVDNGELLAKQQVVEDRSAHEYLVVNTAFHAPFQEFGTGARFDAEPEFRAIAAQFKGIKNGNFSDFLAKIREWCVRKQIDPDNAWIICVSILRNGLRPRPFLQPAYYKVQPVLIKRLKTIISEAIRQ